MTTPLEAAKRLCPTRNNDYLDGVLWNCTCFPFGRPRRYLRQLVKFEQFAKRGWSICSRCGDPYIHKSGKVWIDQTCEKCEERK